MDNKELNILIVGIGHHSRRIYIPALVKYQASFPIKIFGLDFIRQKSIVDEYLNEKKINVTMDYLDPYPLKEKLPWNVLRQINAFTKDNHINAVIISTDPTSHKLYADWALDNGMHILLDKPISTRRNVSSNERIARKLESDYQELLKKYKKLQNKKRTVFSVNTQRRYEIGYLKAFDLIKEVSDRFNCPVTSIQSSHSDGVWIFPDEIVEQSSHPYNEGYGKCSHSGFHLFDIVWQFYKAGLIASKTPDSAEVFSSFVTPDGLLTQINQDDYKKYFGDEYLNNRRRSEKELFKLFPKYGENDAFSIIRLLKNKHNICNISINLLHNSFSRRAWPEPSKDLYKGNGRIKHQFYHIQQGPFQCLQIHNYQSNDQQENNTVADFELGGNNHFEIYVFRNDRMFGGNTKPLEVIKLPDLIESGYLGNQLYHEAAKYRAILEFIQSITGDYDIDKPTSGIASYDVPVKIMSAIYQSNARQLKRKNPIVKFNI